MPSADHTAEHSALVNAALKTYGREPGVRLWRNSVIRMVKGQPRAQPGLQKGAADIVGIVRTRAAVTVQYDGEQIHEVGATGRFCAFECKTGGGRPTKEQAMFLDMVRANGGFACVFRSLEDFGDAIERARDGAAK